MTTLKSAEKAQSLVEFAIFLPIVTALLFLLIEVSFLLWDVIKLQQMTREIARYAAKGVDYYSDTTSAEESSVFAVARTLGVTNDEHALRVVYIELADVEGTATIVEIQTTYFGLSTAMRDIDVAAEYQAFINFTKRQGNYTPLDNAVWIVVDIVYFRTPATDFFGNVLLRLPARAVFQVTYQRRKQLQNSYYLTSLTTCDTMYPWQVKKSTTRPATHKCTRRGCRNGYVKGVKGKWVMCKCYT